MKKGIRLLAVLAAAFFLLGGCGTQLYEMTKEEEELVVQAAAYMLSKYNIYQKDGMNSAQPKEEEEIAVPESTQPEDGGTQDASGSESGQPVSGEESPGESDTKPLQEISLAEAIGYKDSLSVSYDGFSLMDIYREGSFFSLSAERGNTFAVMKFTIHNRTDKDIEIDNFDKGYAFYCSFEGAQRIPEKESFIADSLASFEGKIAAGESAGAVLIFEISKEQAELISEPSLSMEHNGTDYSVTL